VGAIAPGAMIAFWALALGGSLVLAAVHALTPQLDRLSERRQVWLNNFAGGVGLAYVVLYLLFELAKNGAAKIQAALPLTAEPLETMFLMLLASLAIASSLRLRLQQSPDLRHEYFGVGAFFLAYNVLAGAGLVEEAEYSLISWFFYLLALSLHLLFNDMYLTHLCPKAHTPRWRLALAVAPVVGAGLAGFLYQLDAVQYTLLTFVAGMTIINVLRQELPSPDTFRPTGFLAGVIVYAAVIVATWRL
jgi:hypothetical protein